MALTVKQAASAAHCSVNHIRTLAKAGKIKFEQAGPKKHVQILETRDGVRQIVRAETPRAGFRQPSKAHTALATPDPAPSIGIQLLKQWIEFSRPVRELLVKIGQKFTEKDLVDILEI